MQKILLERWLLAALFLGLSFVGATGQQDNVTVDEEPDIITTAEIDDLSMMENMTDAPENMNMTSSTQAPTGPTNPPTGEGGCYTSLDAVYFFISNDDLLFQQKRFVICPNTVMEVGFLVPGVGIDQGQAPLVPRSNTEFLCGEDGKSENNCIIKGGDFGVIAVPVFFRQDLAVNNVQIRGFTFEGQVQYASFVATSGDISYYDCIIRDSANFGPFVFNFDSTLDLGRRLEVADEYDNPWEYALDYITQYRAGSLPRRKLEEADVKDRALLPGHSDSNGRALQGDTFESTIKDCLFSNLQQVERKLGVEFGVLSIKGGDHIVTIEDTTFANNKYGNQELTPIGYGILIQSAEVTMTNLCFVDNDFRGTGAVLLEQTDDPFNSNLITGNYATEDDEDLECPFAAYFETDEDRRNSDFTCVPVQADECGGEPFDTPITPSQPAETNGNGGETGGSSSGGEGSSSGGEGSGSGGEGSGSGGEGSSSGGEGSSSGGEGSSSGGEGSTGGGDDDREVPAPAPEGNEASGATSALSVSGFLLAGLAFFGLVISA